MAVPSKKFIVSSILCLASFIAASKDYPASLFGIYSDGVTLNTRSIQFGIDYISSHGGGRLVFDVGRFLTGSIHLRSNVTLHLREGAVIVGSLNPFDYDKEMYTALILSKDQQNIGITGEGIIDGQGTEVARNVADLVQKGLVTDAFRNDRPEAENRAMLIYFRNCENICVRKVTLRNAASWVQTYDQSKNISIDSVTVDSRAFWNNDGFDIVDCDSVSITNCNVNTADDGICLKSHDAGKVCENVSIRNCMIRSSASAIKFGTASFGGFRHVRVVNIRVFDTYRSVIALEAVDGGFIEDVEADSVTASNTGNGIFLRIGERVPGKKGRLEHITINHFTATIAGGKPDSGYRYEGPIEHMPRNISPAVVIAGIPGARISDVALSDISIVHPGGGDSNFAKVPLTNLDAVPEMGSEYPEFSMFRELPAWGVYIRHAEGIHTRKLALSTQKKDYRPAIVMDDTHQSEFISTRIEGGGNKSYQYRSSGVYFH